MGQQDSDPSGPTVDHGKHDLRHRVPGRGPSGSEYRTADSGVPDSEPARLVAAGGGEARGVSGRDAPGVPDLSTGREEDGAPGVRQCRPVATDRAAGLRRVMIIYESDGHFCLVLNSAGQEVSQHESGGAFDVTLSFLAI